MGQPVGQRDCHNTGRVIKGTNSLELLLLELIADVNGICQHVNTDFRAKKGGCYPPLSPLVPVAQLDRAAAF